MPVTHYDVLELKPDCDAKEIRIAFIKLSKVHHPDAASSETSTHADFVKINEAYSILSKPETRREYDISLRIREVPYYSGTTAYGHRRHPGEEFIFRPGQGFRQAKNEPYYGIKGLRRISNSYIVWACVIFTFVGAGLQAIAIKKSFAFSKEKLNKQSIESYNAYQEVRERATSTNREQQFDRLRNK